MELIFVKLIETHTHVPSVTTSQVQSSAEMKYFCNIRKIYTLLENNPLNGIIIHVYTCILAGFTSSNAVTRQLERQYT